MNGRGHELRRKRGSTYSSRWRTKKRLCDFMKMNQSGKVWCTAAMTAYFAAGLWCEAGLVSGDFEAKAVLQRGDSVIALPVSVLVTVASPTAVAPKFSGKVILGGVSQSIVGTFVPDVGGEGSLGLSAQVTTLKGVPPFTLYYRPPVVGSEFEEEVSDALTVSFAEYGDFEARSSVTLSALGDGTDWTLTDVFAGAFRLGAQPVESLEQRLSGLDGAVAGVSETVATISNELSGYRNDLKSVETELASAKAAPVRKTGSRLLKAWADRENAIQVVDKRIADAEVALASKMVSLSPEEGVDFAGDAARQILERFVAEFLQPAAESGDSAALASLREYANAVKALVATKTDETFDSLLSDLPYLLSFPSYDTAGTREIWGVFAAHVVGITDAATLVGQRYTAAVLVAESMAPDLVSELEASEFEIRERSAALVVAQSSVAQATQRLNGAKASLQSANALRSLLQGARAIAGFGGYGTFQGSVKAASSQAGTAGPVTALFAGVTPDGQKFTSSSKLRASESDTMGLYHVNTRAGSRPLITDIAYSIDVESKAGIARSFAADRDEDAANWSGFAVEQTVGAAVFPTKVEEQGRDDFGRSMNIFGGPLDENGLVAGSVSATSSVVVAFGESMESGAITGFGASVSNTNAVQDLLVERNGSAFRMSVSSSAASTFQGSFPLQGTVASPFSGIFLRLEEEGVVKGFGSLVSSKTTSVPVSIYVSEISSETEVPATPDVPFEPVVVWSGLSSGVMAFQLNDMPVGLNVTTVKLYKGQGLQPIATAEASADGRVLFSSKGLVAGDDYTLEVHREYLSGTRTSQRSGFFEISVRSLPAYSYQMLIGPEEGGVTRNGLTHQGRLTVTTTPSGAWSGKLEWVNLAQVTDTSGELAGYRFSSEQGELALHIPTIVTYPLKGQFSVPEPDDERGPEVGGDNELRSVITIPTGKELPGHQLRISLYDSSFDLDESQRFVTGPVGPVALRAVAEVDLDSAIESVSPQGGVAYPATKGVLGAKGKYNTVSVDLNGEALNNQSHLFDYSGGSTMLYTLKTGSKFSKLTSAANVSISGEIPLLVSGVVSKSTTVYQNAFGNNARASMATLVSGVLSPTVVANLEDGSFVLSGAALVASGNQLEVSSKSKGGYIFREEWANSSQNWPTYFANADSAWGFVRRFDLADTKRYADFGDQRMVPNVPYTFELVLDDATVVTDSITFNASGKATFSNNELVGAITLNATFSTGALVARVKLQEGQVNPRGKQVVSSGFALPGTLLLGWGGVEGGDVGWRIRP